MPGSHYVYVHRRADTGSVFYVGQGHKGRSSSASGRNVHWHRIVKKHGYTIHKIAENLHPLCALSIERAVIKFHGRDSLCNLTDGGDIGPTGMRKSESERRRQSDRMKGNTNTLGRTLSPEHKAAISAAGKGRVVSEDTRAKLRGRPVSDETKSKISEALKGRVMDDDWRAKNAAGQRRRPPPSAETRAKISAAGKGKNTGQNNPAFGIPKTEAQKESLRAAMTGRRYSPETLAKRSGDNHWKRRAKRG